MGPRPSGWATGTARRAAVADRRATSRRGRCATRPAGDGGERDGERRQRRVGAVRRHSSHRGRRPVPGSSTRSPAAAGSFYTLTSGTPAGGGPAEWTVKGSNDDGRSGRCSTALRRDVPVAQADAAVQGRPAGQLRALPARGRGRGTLGRDRAPQPRRGRSPLGTEVGAGAAWAGSTVPVRVDVWN